MCVSVDKMAARNSDVLTNIRLVGRLLLSHVSRATKYEVSHTGSFYVRF